MDLKHSCNAAATASAQVDFVATVPKPKSARATSRQRASSSGEDELGIHLNFESSSSIPVATTSGTSPLRPWSFTDAPIGPKGTIFGWQTECPKSATYAAAGVIPFAYREDEQELYVLMSFQLSDRNPKTSLVYTFLGGKVAGGDKNNPCRTAAREAHEETHRVLDEQLVLNALLGKVPAYGSGSSVRKSVSPRDASAATAVPSPAPVTPASAAACDAIPIDAAANARADAAGRYTAFAMHLPNAWHLPEICQKRIMDKQKHPQAKKAEGLAWVSLRQLALLRAGKDVKDDVSGRTGSGHHYVLMLMRAGGQPVGVFKWLQSLEAHLRHWHGLPETNDQQKQVTKAARGEGADSKMRAGASGSESGGGQEHDLGLVKPRVVLNTKAKVGKDAQQHQQRAFYTVWAIDGSSQQVLVKQAQPKPPLSLLRLESSAAPSAVAARVAPSGLAQPSALPASLQPPQQVAPSAAMTHQSDGDSVPLLALNSHMDIRVLSRRKYPYPARRCNSPNNSSSGSSSSSKARRMWQHMKGLSTRLFFGTSGSIATVGHIGSG
ncbi:hypothetical protein VOLCADRAFT_96615 [Volvox carteri f. nagariensis]|uniref:Nudix hydrolase domain-containing protein n=1 Tax=Volvox carteri f. nagariensis TaxID=3068 RepID=D8UAK6_VOLCA|nr:uncharacterized protein VOLCADRAFT_96615 [Volvox carteri f. nagariensis]EFJ43276.1 hypothetical protein VOLCADRAFT_96615 [Volvox carteri f. nagariensis]|eukprot:XP_002955636.1 hypothetical protein VOLCADRAFT_96615 [Volvox carteri f. nagariensis]